MITALDYNQLEKAPAIPEAAPMIETLRAIGYSLDTALADIIDNSITAGAKRILIRRIWRGGQSVITIKDDGYGMNSMEIQAAMRPGAQNPLEERPKNDLGRFGLGLKTASFSQCRKLTVLSKRHGYHSTYWTWDLDYVAQSQRWELLKWVPEEFEKELDDINHGTLVIWSDLDRLVPPETKDTSELAKEKFSKALDKAKRHLSMTFHRFIEDGDVKICWGGYDHELKPWNPFCDKEPRIQIEPTEKINGSGVVMKGYILPRKNDFSSEQAYNDAEGINGWSAQQGFYVYRERRLLVAGDWLGIRRKDEHFKLVRIRIDLPNNLDADWHIDIKKSKAYPPSTCIDQLKSYASNCCIKGEKILQGTHKAAVHQGHELQQLWIKKKKNNRWYFVINRDHQMIKDVQKLAEQNPSKAINALLSFLEEAIPAKASLTNSQIEENDSTIETQGIDITVIENLMKIIYDQRLSEGMTPEQAKSTIYRLEPFNKFPDKIEEL